MTGPGFWRSLLQTIAKNPISLFAVLCVAATASFLGFMAWRLIAVLESPKWCGNALQAERITEKDTFVGLTSCVELLKVQLEAVATGFHISLGSFAFSLIVLIVVVVAGARASGKIAGMAFDVSRHDPAAEGAKHVREAAQDAEAEVKEGTAP